MKNFLFYLILSCFLVLSSCKKDDYFVGYDTAECVYYGNVQGTGTGLFILRLSSVRNNFVYIQGYGTLKPFADFALEEGTWQFGSKDTWGNEKTFSEGGLQDDDTPVGSIIVENNRLVFITGGSFEASYSDGFCTIATNFTGIDYDTGKTLKNIRQKFSGKIRYTNESNDDSDRDYDEPLSFESIRESAYNATVRAGFSATDQLSWDGQIIPDVTFSCYDFTNFFDEEGSIQLVNYVDGKLYLNTQYPVIASETQPIAGWIEYAVVYDFGSGQEAKPVLLPKKPEIKFNKATGEFDFDFGRTNINFGGTIGNVENLQIYTGIYLYEYPSFNEIGWYTDVYRDIKVVPAFSATQKSAKYMKNEGAYNKRAAANTAITDLKPVLHRNKNFGTKPESSMILNLLKK